jgi:signal peptidase I
MTSERLCLHERTGIDPAERSPKRTDPGVFALFEDILNSGVGLRVRVTGRSMIPLLRGGELLTLRKVPCSSLKRGDLIFFRNREGCPILHRIVHTIRGKNGAIAFQTKGDALIAFDGTVHDQEILGKVCRIEKGAKCIDMETGIQRRLNYLIAVTGLLKSRFRFALGAFRNLV